MDLVNIHLLAESHQKLLTAIQYLTDVAKLHTAHGSKDGKNEFISGAAVEIMRAEWAIEAAQKLQTKIIIKELSA
jgi:hypothetical protein